MSKFKNFELFTERYHSYYHTPQPKTPDRPALYKENDIVYLKSETKCNSSYSNRDHYHNNRSGVIVQIKGIDTSKSSLKRYVYEARILYGIMSSETTRSYNMSTSGTILVDEKDLSFDNVEEFNKILKTQKFKLGEEIMVPKGTTILNSKRDNENKTTTKTHTMKILYYTVDPTLESKNVVYGFENPSYNKSSIEIAEKDISKELEVPIKAYEMLSKEISKILDIDYEKYFEIRKDDEYGSNDKEIKLQIKFEGASNMFGEKQKMLFKDKESVIAFYNDLKKVYEKHRNKKLEKATGKIPTLETYSEYDDQTYTFRGKKILEFARNLGIDVEKFVETHRGLVHGANLGLI